MEFSNGKRGERNSIGEFEKRESYLDDKSKGFTNSQAKFDVRHRQGFGRNSSFRRHKELEVSRYFCVLFFKTTRDSKWVAPSYARNIRANKTFKAIQLININENAFKRISVANRSSFMNVNTL